MAATDQFDGPGTVAMGKRAAAAVQRHDARPVRRTDGTHQDRVEIRAVRFGDADMLGRNAGMGQEGEQGKERGHRASTEGVSDVVTGFGASSQAQRTESEAMPDTIDPAAGGPYASGLERRVSILEEDVREIRGSLSRLEAGMIRIEAILPSLATREMVGGTREMVGGTREMVGRIEAMLAATLPHLATKAELAEKPSKAYLWGIIGVLITSIFGAFAATLAAVSILH